MSADVDRKKSLGQDVIQIHQPLSERMATIQTAIIECMDATLSELKRSNTVIEVDDLTVQNALFRSFDAVIRSQLDPQWHRIGPKTRQLVNDLATLRQLLTYLLSFDAVSFNQFLDTILASNTTNFTTGKAVLHPSPWLFLPAADTILETARERVYKKVAVQPDKADTNKDKAILPAPSGKQNGSGTTVKEGSVATTRPVAEDEDEYWNDQDDSIFDNEALMTATASAPAVAPPEGSAGSSPAKEARAAEDMIHDLTQDDETPDDNTAEAFRTLSDKAKGKQRATTDIPDDLYNARLDQKGPWTYWSPEGTIPVLEEQPKWFVLREILDEIENQIHWSPVDFNESVDTAVNDTILIMCNSVRTVTTLRKYLSSIPELNREATTSNEDRTSQSGRELLLARAAEYFLWKGSMGKLSRGIKAASTTTLAGIVYNQDQAQNTGAAANGQMVRAGPSNGVAGGKDNNYESAALKRKSMYKHGQHVNKRRRVRGGGTINPNDRSSTKVKPPGGLSTDILEREAAELADASAHASGAGEDGLTSALPATLQEVDEEFDPVAFNEYFGLLETEQTVIIRAFAGDEDDRILEELRPKYVVIYDPDPAFVRRLEVSLAYSVAVLRLVLTP